MSEEISNDAAREIIVTVPVSELSSPYMVQLNILKAGIVDAILEEMGIGSVIIIKGGSEE